MRLSSWLRSARSLFFVPSGIEKGRPPTRLRKRTLAAPLRVEALEDRLAPATATVTSLTAAPDPSQFKESVTFTATVLLSPGPGTPTGTVTFGEHLGDADPANDVLLGSDDVDGSGVATITTVGLPVGSHTVQATFNDASGNFGGSSGSTTQMVTPGATATSLTSAPDPSAFGQPVTFTATVTSSPPSAGTPTGAVTFVDTLGDADPANDVLLGSGGPNGSGVATLTTAGLRVGSRTVLATYHDPSGNFGDSSATTTQVVSQGATTTSLTSAPDPSEFGHSVTFTATVTPSAPGSVAAPGGTVTFRVDGAVAATVAVLGGKAAFATSSLPPGTHAVTASFVSNAFEVLDSGPVSRQQSVVRNLFAVGTDAGTAGRVFVSTIDGAPAGVLFPYGEFAGGVRVAVGDVNGDGFSDIITGAGPGAGPHVKVFSGRDFSLLASFFAYGAGFSGGVFVAAGDLDGDGLAEIITGAGAGAAPHVKAFSLGRGEVASFMAYGAGFVGGVSVGAADLDGDGRAEILTGSGAGAAHVKAFTLLGQETLSFLAFGPGYTGGVNVAGGDVDGDGRAELFVGAATLPHVKIFQASTLAERASFFAYEGLATGVRIGAVDRDGDGKADVFIGPSTGTPLAQFIDGESLAQLDDFFAQAPVGGLFVGGSR
jgi:fibronectin-binding autotransporter adhesin